MGLFLSLNREQKEAIGLLQAGTFLEYFDLMLYVHMAVLLNNLFFPQKDPHTNALLSAFAFCSTYVLRPFGALLFGYIGDTIGRKITVIITSTLMAVCCIIMANVPTYAEIGITACWVVSICRVLQGVLSLGEIVGAEIYLVEITKPPERYPAVAFLSAAASFGSTFALGIATLVIFSGLNWRLAFWIGAIIAIIGFRARKCLRETIEFADMQRRIKRVQAELEKEWIDNVISMVGFAFRKKLRETIEFSAAKKQIKNIVEAREKEKVNWQIMLAFFFIHCGWPVFFYLSFIYCANLLQKNFAYTGGQIIQHNFIVSLASLISMVFFTILSYRVHPLKILRAKLMIFLPFALLIPFILYSANTPLILMLFSVFCIFFAPIDAPAAAVLIAHFPVFKRFTYVSFMYAISRAAIYIITSFGLVYLTKFFSYWGLLIIVLPTMLGFYWGVNYFEVLEASVEFINKKKSLSRHLREQGLR